MSEFVTVARVGAIAEGQGGTFQVGERLVAVFNRGGEYFAIDDLCPHMGASGGDLPLARLALFGVRRDVVRQSADQNRRVRDAGRGG